MNDAEIRRLLFSKKLRLPRGLLGEQVFSLIERYYPLAADREVYLESLYIFLDSRGEKHITTTDDEEWFIGHRFPELDIEVLIDPNSEALKIHRIKEELNGKNR